MKLFSPLQVGPVRLKNRIVMPAMHLGYTPQGEVTDRLVEFYRERAAGGPALIIVGGCAIDRMEGMAGMVHISDDRFLPGLERLARAIHDEGARIGVQLYQPGRYARSAMIGGEKALAPSPVRSKLTGETPREMTLDDIQWVIGNFAAGARRAREAGFDAVEILASAGYLISQFLSPITNIRTDRYGGNLEDRMRFGLEVTEAVRESAGPDLAVLVRVAGNDFMPGSHTNLEAGAFAAALEKKGIDALNVTGGWHEARVPQIPMNLPRGVYVYLAQGIGQKVQIPVIACNRINDPQLAENILQQNRADLVGVARGMIADPEWANKARAGRFDQINYCIACNQGCLDHVFGMKPVRCTVNPRAGLEADGPVAPASNPKNIMVIGGGPAGLSFARTAARRGHRVRLFEKSSRLGGQILLSAALPERAEFMTLIHSAEAQAREAGVEIHLTREVTPELVDCEGPDIVVAATGGRPLPCPIPGGEWPHVVQAWDVLAGSLEVGEKIVVIGGGAVGCEAALHLARIGALTPEELLFLFTNEAESPETLRSLAAHGSKDITLIEMSGKIGGDIGQTTGWIIRQDLGRARVKISTRTKALEIKSGGVVVEKNGEQDLIPAETVVLALGTQPEDTLYHALKDRCPRLILIGDASKPAKAYHAVHQGFHEALKV